jgi:hypothetical protein
MEIHKIVLQNSDKIIIISFIQLDMWINKWLLLQPWEQYDREDDAIHFVLGRKA